MEIRASPVGPEIGVRADGPVAADHPAEVAPSIARAFPGCRGELPRPHQFVVDRQMRALTRAAPGARDELPPALRQEPMIAARDELGSVLQCDPEGRLDRRPVRQYGGRHVPAILT